MQKTIKRHLDPLGVLQCSRRNWTGGVGQVSLAHEREELEIEALVKDINALRPGNVVGESSERGPGPPCPMLHNYWLTWAGRERQDIMHSVMGIASQKAYAVCAHGP